MWKILIDIDVNYFSDNDGNGTDDFNYFMKHDLKSPYPSMNCKHTTIKKCKNNDVSWIKKNSSGYDEISIKILKVSSPCIGSPLNYICNEILSMGVFPDWVKYIKPLHKNGNKHDVSNFRPVSLLTFYSKFLENIMQ